MSELERGQVLTANRLIDGEVVYFTRSGQWSEIIDDAVVALEAQAAKALEARGILDEKAGKVTGIYLFDALRENGHVRAEHIRERIRALGPTIRSDLGKQATGTGGAFAATSESV